MGDIRAILAALRSVPRRLSRDASTLPEVVRTLKPLLALSDAGTVRGARPLYTAWLASCHDSPLGFGARRP